MTSALLNTRLTAMIKILSLAPVTFPNLPAEIVEEGLWRSTESRGLKAIKRLFQRIRPHRQIPADNLVSLSVMLWTVRLQIVVA